MLEFVSFHPNGLTLSYSKTLYKNITPIFGRYNWSAVQV